MFNFKIKYTARGHWLLTMKSSTPWRNYAGWISNVCQACSTTSSSAWGGVNDVKGGCADEDTSKIHRRGFRSTQPGARLFFPVTIPLEAYFSRGHMFIIVFLILLIVRLQYSGRVRVRSQCVSTWWSRAADLCLNRLCCRVCHSPSLWRAGEEPAQTQSGTHILTLLQPVHFSSLVQYVQPASVPLY